MSIAQAQITTHSVEETISFGKLLGSSACPGDLICLAGDLGSGKTHLVKGIAAALGLEADRIASPTYTLITEHHEGSLALYHMDAYRIRDPSELGPIGFDDYLSRGDGIFVIEWSDLIARNLPDQRLEIAFASPDPADQPDMRSIAATAYGSRAVSHLRDVLADPIAARLIHQ